MKRESEKEREIDVDDQELCVSLVELDDNFQKVIDGWNKRKKIRKKPSADGGVVHRIPQKMGHRSLEALSQLHYNIVQAVSDEVEQEQQIVQKEVATKEPILILHISDIHFGAKSMNLEYMLKIKKFILENKHVYVILNGDLINGFKAEYGDTISADSYLNNDEQFTLFKRIFLEPIAHEGKILSLTTGFGGHEEWMRLFTQVDSSRVLLGDMPVDVITNGGILEIHYQNGHVEKILIAHDGGGGGSSINPVGTAAQLARDNPDLHINVTSVGHSHFLNAIRQTVGLDSESKRNALVIKTEMASGAFKGNFNQKRKDPFFRVRFGNRATAEPGVGSVYYQNKGVERAYHVKKIEDAAELLKAIQVWSLLAAQRHGDLEAELERIRVVTREKFGEPKIVFQRTMSHTRRAEGDPTKHWSRVSYATENYVTPIAILPLNGIRTGSRTSLLRRSDSEPMGVLQEIIDLINGDPQIFGLVLREALDETLVKDRKRISRVEQLVNTLGPLWNIGSDGQPRIKTLGWQFSSSMRNKIWGKYLPGASELRAEISWAKKTKNEKAKQRAEEQLELLSPFLPGTYVNDITHIPLLDNKAIIDISSGNLRYSTFVLDQLMRSTSYVSDPTRGQVRMEQVWEWFKKPNDLILGGAGIHAAALQWYNIKKQDTQVLIAPPWLAVEHNRLSVGNREVVPNSVFGAILSMDHRAIFPTVTREQFLDVFQALTLLSGFNALGEYEAVVQSLQKKPRKKAIVPQP